jgi:MFS family permease
MHRGSASGTAAEAVTPADLGVDSGPGNRGGDQALQRPRWTMVVLALAMLTASLGASIVNVALPSLAVAWGTSFAAMQWVVVSYLLASTASVVAAGRLGDLIGERRLLFVGLLLVAVAATASALAPSLPVLIAARAVQGVGAAVLMALTVAIARAVAVPQRTGAAMGLLGTMSAIGTALGPSLGGALVAAFGWRMAFFAAAPLAGAALLLGLRFLPRAGEPRVARERFDVAGTAWLAATLTAFALATTARGLGAWQAVAWSATLFGGAAFVVAERRAQSPLLPSALLGERGLADSLVANAVVSAVMMATLVVGPFHLVHALGLEPGHAGLVMSVGPLVSALVGVPAGRLVDRFGAPRIALAGLLGVALGTGALAAWAGAMSVFAYVGPLAMTTASYAGFSAANNTSVMAGASGGRRGVLSGLLNLSRNLGLMSGSAGLGALFAVACGTDEIAFASLDVIGAATQTTFSAASGAVLLVGGFVAWRSLGSRRS